MHYQWLATTFLSDDRIAEIRGSNKAAGDEKAQDSSLIEIPKARDDTIEQYMLKDDNSKFIGYVLIIKDPTRVKVGITSKLNIEGQTTSEIADNYNAVAAINGGYFTDEKDTAKWSSNGGIPTGYLMSEGIEKHNEIGNGSALIVGITNEGKMLVGKWTVAELMKRNVTEAMSYETTLVKDGEAVSIKESTGTSPKTMIGQKKDGSIVLVVLDSKSSGIIRVAATLEEAQQVMMKLDCLNAVNLDGGKSATMYYNGEVINNPSNALGERPIASGFIVK